MSFFILLIAAGCGWWIWGRNPDGAVFFPRLGPVAGAATGSDARLAAEAILPNVGTFTSALGRPAPIVSGFGDPAWEPLGPPHDSGAENAFAPGQMTLRSGGFRHPGVLAGAGANFDVDIDLGWNPNSKSQGAVLIGLFDLPEAAEGAPIQISFSRWGNRTWVAASRAGGTRMIDGDDIIDDDAHLTVRIERRADQLKVFVNGVELVDAEVKTDESCGNGLRVQFGGPWFNADTKLEPVTVGSFQVRPAKTGAAPSSTR